MAKFCTGCGVQLEQDARFCEECGRPVVVPAPAAAAATPRPATPTPPTPAPIALPKLSLPSPGQGRKIALMAGAALAVLAIAGGAVYFLTKYPAPPGAEEIASLLNADKNLVESITCLSNFDYSANPVHVATYDSRTQSWLAALVAGGVYTGPTREVTGNGFFTQETLSYSQTEEGKKAVRGKKLCFAPGISVDTVKYEERPQNAKPPRIRGVITYRYQQSAPWANTPGAKQAMPERFGKDSFEMPVGFVLTEGKWYAQNSKEAQAEVRKHTGAQEGRSPARPSAKESSGGLFSFLDDLFGGNPGSALQGRWAARDGIIPLTFEFRPKSAVIMGQELAVSYRKDKDLIEVLPVEGPTGATVLKLKVVSADELRMADETGIALRLTRLK